MSCQEEATHTAAGLAEHLRTAAGPDADMRTDAVQVEAIPEPPEVCHSFDRGRGTFTLAEADAKEEDCKYLPLGYCIYCLRDSAERQGRRQMCTQSDGQCCFCYEGYCLCQCWGHLAADPVRNIDSADSADCRRLKSSFEAMRHAGITLHYAHTAHYDPADYPSFLRLLQSGLAQWDGTVTPEGIASGCRKLLHMEQPAKLFLAEACAWNEDRRPDRIRTNSRYRIDPARAVLESEIEFMEASLEKFNYEEQRRQRDCHDNEECIFYGYSAKCIVCSTIKRPAELFHARIYDPEEPAVCLACWFPSCSYCGDKQWSYKLVQDAIGCCCGEVDWKATRYWPHILRLACKEGVRLNTYETQCKACLEHKLRDLALATEPPALHCPGCLPLRVCVRCGEHKSHKAFDKNAYGNFHTVCSKCEERAAEETITKEKQCTGCQKMLPHSAFRRLENRHYASRCGTCERPPCHKCNRPYPKRKGPFEVNRSEQHYYCSEKCRWPPCRHRGCDAQRPQDTHHTFDRVAEWKCPAHATKSASSG